LIFKGFLRASCGQVTSCWWAAQGGVAMTGLLVHGATVPGDGALPVIGVEWPLAAQHGEREPVRAVPDRDQSHQGRLAAGHQLAPVGDEVGVVQADTTAQIDYALRNSTDPSRLIPVRVRDRPADS
jgi:hypothetical protein